MGRGIKRPPYTHGFVDRHGKARFYFRRPGFKRAPLPGLPWSPEFMEAYQAALAAAPRLEIGASRTVAGTVNAVVIGYFGSAAFQNLAPASQRQYRGILERLRREHGDKKIATLERRNVIALVNAKAATPAAARDLLYCLRVLVRYAIDIGLRDSVQRPESKSPGKRAMASEPGQKRTLRHSRRVTLSVPSRDWRLSCCCTPHNGAPMS
jgi:hypothetical protein